MLTENIVWCLKGMRVRVCALDKENVFSNLVFVLNLKAKNTLGS